MRTVNKGFVPIAVVLLVVVAGAVIFFVSRSSAPEDGDNPAMMNEVGGKLEGEMMSEGESGTPRVKAGSADGGAMMDTGADTSMMGKADSDSMTAGSKPPSYSGTVLAGTSSLLLDFTSADYEKAKESGKLVVLYFYANWCPLCKAETKEALYPAFNELTHDTVVGFQVSYSDNETSAEEKALAREFGVGYQHTKVFVKDGKRLLKSPEGWNKERYLAEITKASTP